MAELQPQSGTIEAHALARHVRMSPQKARLVMDLIRGQKAQAALQNAALHAEARGQAHRKSFAQRHRQCRTQGGGCWRAAGCRRTVREHLLRERRRAVEAFAPRANGFALSAIRSAPRICGWASRSITWPPRNAWLPSKRKPKRKRACVAPRVACAKHWPASRAVLRRARSRRLGRSRERGDKSGTENAPLRIPPRLQQAVEVALVRGPRLR